MFRVIWRYRTGWAEKTSELESVLESKRPPGMMEFDGIRFPEPPSRVFGGSVKTTEISASDPSLEKAPNSKLRAAAYLHVFTETLTEAEVLKEQLTARPDIEWVDIQAPIKRPVVFSQKRVAGAAIETLAMTEPSRDFTHLKDFRAPAPKGVDTDYAWQIPGGKGNTVHIVDIEDGWNFIHEDLLNTGGVIYGRNINHDHGTAVLGIYSADHNETGIDGMTPEARSFTASHTGPTGPDKWNAAEAIRNAAERLVPGDIILLEMQSGGPNWNGVDDDGLVPIEYWESEWLAIRAAVDMGIHVVEAAGNGSVDLDDPLFKGLFSRGEYDSGAIMVGAGGSGLCNTAREALDFTNYGSRVDVQAWGECIVTCGGNNQPGYNDLICDRDSNLCYTERFGGTSGAAPIVVGCVAAIVGARRAAGLSELTPAEMRDLLINTGTAQIGSKHIGPLPDIRAALGG